MCRQGEGPAVGLVSGWKSVRGKPTSPRQHKSWPPKARGRGLRSPASCLEPKACPYLARPTTTVCAQGCMISAKEPWSKKPVCQDPFVAAGEEEKTQKLQPGPESPSRAFATHPRGGERPARGGAPKQLALTGMRPPCQHPPGVVGGFGGDKIDLPFHGVARGHDRYGAAVVLREEGFPPSGFS